MEIRKIDPQTFVETTVDLDIPFELVQSLQKGILEAGFLSTPSIIAENENQLVIGAIQKREVGGPDALKWRITIEKV
jgi:hypothetical protein